VTFLPEDRSVRGCSEERKEARPMQASIQGRIFAVLFAALASALLVALSAGAYARTKHRKRGET
jgi:hypothetical protein